MRCRRQNSAIHPGDGKFVERHADHELSGSVVYLMCNDLRATMDSLQKKGAETTEIVEAGWGITTTVRLPGGGGLGLYQPRHAYSIESAWTNFSEHNIDHSTVRV